MKLLKICRVKKKIYLKFLNICLCKIETDSNLIKYKFLNGIIYFKYNRSSLEYRIRLIGFTIYRKESNDILKYESLYKRLQKKNYLYPNVLIFNGAPSGELYIVLNLLKNIFKNISNDQFLFVVDKKFKKDLCCLYYPNINCLIDKNLNLYVSKTEEYQINNTKFYSFFSTKHYLKQDEEINKKNVHYYDYIHRELKIVNASLFKLPQISKKTSEKIKNYIEENNLKNFIIISPEANTCSKYSESFWKNLCEQLKCASYEIFLNIMKMENYVEGCYVNYFNYEELIELAKYSNGIVGLRSGLLEILSTLNIPIACIYTSFPKRGALKAMDSSKALTGFTLKKLPGIIVDNISEFDVNNYSEQELINLIIDSLDRNKLCNK